MWQGGLFRCIVHECKKAPVKQSLAVAVAVRLPHGAHSEACCAILITRRLASALLVMSAQPHTVCGAIECSCLPSM